MKMVTIFIGPKKKLHGNITAAGESQKAVEQQQHEAPPNISLAATMWLVTVVIYSLRHCLTHHLSWLFTSIGNFHAGKDGRFLALIRKIKCCFSSPLPPHLSLMFMIPGYGSTVAMPGAVCQEKWAKSQQEMGSQWMVRWTVPHLLPDVTPGSSFTTDLLGTNFSASYPCCHLLAHIGRMLVRQGCFSLHLFANCKTERELDSSLICLYSTPLLQITYWNCPFHQNWDASVKCRFQQIPAQITPLLSKSGHKGIVREGQHWVFSCFSSLFGNTKISFRKSLLKYSMTLWFYDSVTPAFKSYLLILKVMKSTHGNNF